MGETDKSREPMIKKGFPGGKLNPKPPPVPPVQPPPTQPATKG